MHAAVLRLTTCSGEVTDLWEAYADIIFQTAMIGRSISD